MADQKYHLEKCHISQHKGEIRNLFFWGSLWTIVVGFVGIYGIFAVDDFNKNHPNEFAASLGLAALIAIPMICSKTTSNIREIEALRKKEAER